ncbi:GIY-YIG nuclease family protein [Bowmanella dokdonensis]|uniref:GIY-YIG nuclease family protein n=1 Tax=Bowmanella dokdonensis TaxID=751969 RepID=A0A939IS05_9ALTE|nr:GIY-YIG nuclease family protein [Bowmanella dokdonensis]MBN7826664.1 GIY-YIG nuclease family protein [Bowmanella dokdonensis]
MKTEQQWYLYIVENRLGHWYTGISPDPQRRFAEHQQGGPRAAKALKGKGPLTFIYQCWAGDRSGASRLECWVKSLSKDQKRQWVAGTLITPDSYLPSLS